MSNPLYKISGDLLHCTDPHGTHDIVHGTKHTLYRVPELVDYASILTLANNNSLITNSTFNLTCKVKGHKPGIFYQPRPHGIYCLSAKGNTASRQMVLRTSLIFDRPVLLDEANIFLQILRVSECKVSRGPKEYAAKFGNVKL